ncbi:MAG: symmetrical bis(5'-nucleosyl)-tetraphosphatase [Steroidobacteraceae bacterium]
MATYAIGDVQGCDGELVRLLARLRFRSDRDQLWFVGDLVNRGPASLSVLRRVRAMGVNAVCVLGNHDLHLVAVACGVAPLKRGDTLGRVLAARDRHQLIDWLVGLPLMHEDPARGIAMVHAGLPPQWSIALAMRCAREVQQALRTDPSRFLSSMYGDEPRRWSPALRGRARLRFITNCLTRLRYLARDASLELSAKDSPAKTRATLMPWFEHPAARWRGTRILFGHWSTLGFFRNRDVIGLDTGCVWGNRLTAVNLDDPDRPPVSVAAQR